MKIPQSDMPDEAMWQSFFDPNALMRTLVPKAPLSGNAAELGCGYGTFTMAALNSVTGTVYAYEIEPLLCKALQHRLGAGNSSRLTVRCEDVLTQGTGVEPNSLRLVMAFNFLHFADPIPLLTHLHTRLEPGGQLLIIHWRSDIKTPRGPDLSMRPTPQTVYQWCQQAGFEELSQPDISASCPWHFAVVATKASMDCALTNQPN